MKAVDFGKAWSSLLTIAMRWIQHLKLRWKVTKERLHRYSGLISFCGVAVVLTTFIVKDILRDEEKDALSALQAAQHQYYSQADTDRILSGQRAVTDKSSRDDDSYSSYGQVFAQLSAELKRVQKLGESLPREEANQSRETAKRLRQQLEEIGTELGKFHVKDVILRKEGEELASGVDPETARKDSEDLVQCFEKLGTKVDISHDITLKKFGLSIPNLDVSMQRSDLAQQSYKQTNHLIALSGEIDKLEEQILSEASQELNKETRRVKRFTYLSWFLYPAGVFIGVLGQLAGVKPAGSE